MLSWAPRAHADPPAAQHAIARARALGLARSPTWRRLLFYRPAVHHQWESHVDGGDFFFAANGKVDPAAELEATIVAFFTPPRVAADDRHAICRFPARYRWLNEQLHIEPELFAKPRCPALERYLAELDAESASFIYASSFLNNPVSALGHAFLRIKKRARPGDTPVESDTRDHGVDYSADVDTRNAALYVYKGIAGLFPGAFRLRSYDAMLRNYAGYEARDVWQYDLALTRPELEMLVLHLWELVHAHLDYYYLTENCAFQVIAALDAAAPRLDLVGKMKLVVPPLDALEAVYDTPGLVRGITFRPSVRSRLRDSLAKLTPRERQLVAALSNDSDAALPGDLPAESARRILDVAPLAVDARWSKGMINGTNPEALEARARLTERRAALGKVALVLDAGPAPVDKEPHKSHGSMRVVLGTGMTNQYDTGFATLGYRLVLHDLADPPDGQPELLQLEVLDARLRYDYGRKTVTIDRLTFIDMLTLKPITRYDQELSWRVRAFGSRLHDRGAPDAFAHGLGGALGGTLSVESDHVAVFALAETYVLFSTQLDGLGGSAFRVGVGPYGGVRVRLPGETVALVTGSASYLPGQDLTATFDLRAALRTRLGHHVALGLEGAAQPRALEAQLASYLYF